MNSKIKSNSGLKPICSVIDMARMLGLSRARFYQLLEQGVFPQPIYCIRTKRPLYTVELQQICLNVKESNIGYNNQYVLFYSPRKISENPKISRRANAVDKPIVELTETLKRMGLDVDGGKVKKAIEELYPEGLDSSQDQGIVIRDLFRYVKGLLK